MGESDAVVMSDRGGPPRPAAAGTGPGRRLRAYLLLPHPLPIAVVLAATTGFAFRFAGGWPPLPTLVALLLAMLGGQLAIGAVNELVDADLDARTKPWKPIPAGDASPRGARLMAVAGGALLVGFGSPFGVVSFALLVLGTACGLAYDLWLKRTAWSWLPYVLALPLLPIWVHAALVGFEPRLLLLYPLGAGAVAGVHLAQSLPDCAGDAAAGLRNPASRLGEVRTVAAAAALVATAPLAASGAVLLAPSLVTDRSVVLSAAAVALAAAGGTLLAYARWPDRAVHWAFPLLAAATVLLGLAWTAGVG